jgi:hypothetical protein
LAVAVNLLKVDIDALIQNTSGEEDHTKQLKLTKRKYREQFEALKEAKSELSYLDNVKDAAFKGMVRKFQVGSCSCRVLCCGAPVTGCCLFV